MSSRSRAMAPNSDSRERLTGGVITYFAPIMQQLLGALPLRQWQKFQGASGFACMRICMRFEPKRTLHINLSSQITSMISLLFMKLHYNDIYFKIPIHGLEIHAWYYDHLFIPDRNNYDALLQRDFFIISFNCSINWQKKVHSKVCTISAWDASEANRRRWEPQYHEVQNKYPPQIPKGVYWEGVRDLIVLRIPAPSFLLKRQDLVSLVTILYCYFRHHTLLAMA